MKKSKAGFLLVESLIVSTFISVTLLYVYTHFKVVYDSYNTSFKFNTINSLYKANNIKSFLNLSLDPAIFPVVDTSEVVNLETCPVAYVSNTEYCNSLFLKMDIKKLYLITEDITDFKVIVSTNVSYSQNLENFLDYIRHGLTGYRLIAEFNDGTIASINAF